jgi:hypothetical protein
MGRFAFLAVFAVDSAFSVQRFAFSVSLLVS